MATMGKDVQEPTIGILKHTYTLMRNLPKKMIEIFFRFRRFNLLVDGIAAN
tara:strand:- start:320 stop:472 length:153 start_codon:yes stop_codon:yes gene_type:complete